MDYLKIRVGVNMYDLEVAETDEDRYDGLAGDDELADNEGMFFIFEENGPHPMVMRGMEIPIDIIHTTQEGVVNAIATAQPDDTSEFQGEFNSRFVIELAAGQIENSGVKVGDRINIPLELHQYIAETRGIGIARAGASVPTGGQDTVKKYNVQTTDIPEHQDYMQVLDKDGKVVLNIKEGARIFSRKHTEQLVAALEKGDKDENLKELAKMMVEMIYKQDTQKPEYST